MGGDARFTRPVAASTGTDAGTETPRRSWRDKVRHAVDLTVAFVTLDDAPFEANAPDVGLVGPGKDAGRGAAARPRASAHTARGREATSDAPAVDDRHPHRTPLRPMPRSRRPGAAAHRPQVCIAPVRPEPAAPKRRTRTA
jgi:hypothetical protein